MYNYYLASSCIFRGRVTMTFSPYSKLKLKLWLSDSKSGMSKVRLLKPNPIRAQIYAGPQPPVINQEQLHLNSSKNVSLNGQPSSHPIFIPEKLALFAKSLDDPALRSHRVLKRGLPALDVPRLCCSCRNARASRQARVWSGAVHVGRRQAAGFCGQGDYKRNRNR